MGTVIINLISCKVPTYPHYLFEFLVGKISRYFSMSCQVVDVIHLVDNLKGI